MVDKFDIRYYLLQKHVNNVFRLNFSKLIISGKENIPKDKPIIYAPTHRNALVDALILVYENITHQVVFLARADIFKKKTIRKILHFLRILPVYRIRDGKENLGKNKEIFETCGRILKQNNPICLFPEAVHNPHQSLLPLRKAIPRIAFPTEEAEHFALDTHVVPVAFYYTNKDKFLSDLYVDYGKPLRVKDYEELYKKDPNAAINTFRHDMDARLRKYVVDIPSDDYNELAALIDVNTASAFGKHFTEANGRILAAQSIIEHYKNLKLNNLNEYISRITQIDKTLKILTKHGLTPKAPLTSPLTSSQMFFRYSLLAFLSPLAALGVLNTIFPIIIYRKLLGLFSDKQFISSVRIVCGIFVIPCFYLLQAILFGIIAHSWIWAFFYLLASPILFNFGIYWRKYFKEILQQRMVNKFYNNNKDIWKKCIDTLTV